MATIRIGLSGFSYVPWRGEGRFYPEGTAQTKFLGYYTTRYDCVEMDGTMYRVPTDSGVAGWMNGTPDGFCFCMKTHQAVTHMRRLKPECLESINFMLPRVLPLAKAGKLGPFLVQLPPNFKRDDERLETFVRLLPRDMSAIEGGSAGESLRWAMEFRHESWNVDAVETILRANDVAWVASDRDVMPAQKRDTASFMYARLRRSEYSDKDLDGWADYFRASGKDCFVFCKHEDEGSPWVWADYLLGRLR